MARIQPATAIAAGPALSLPDVSWLLVSLALVAAPHALRLPLWIAPLAAALAFWRWHIAHRGLALPRKLALVPLVVAVTASVYLSHGDLLGRDAGVSLLVMMLALKLLETTRPRDAMLMLLFGYFLVITNFLYSESVSTALYMLLGVVAITATMINFHHGPSPAALRNTLRIALLLVAQAAPLMLVLFILFPRVQGPLWGVQYDKSGGSTGLSDTMAPGSMSQLSLSRATAFRAKFETAPPAQYALYWRGPVLWDFDGRTWSGNARQESVADRSYVAKSVPLRYAVTLEPHGKTSMLALDLPIERPRDSKLTPDFQIIASAPVTTRMRYEMASVLDYHANVDASDDELRRALRLPDNSNPRARALAKTLRSDSDSDRDIVDAALALFRQQPFFYTLSPPLLGAQAVDEFLFDKRRGFCEHYASSFTFLMRAAGVPARVVTGYQGGEINPLDDYMVVRQADAHAWAEVWLLDRGWVRIDPTAAVAPSRVEQGVTAALPAEEAFVLANFSEQNWLRPARLTWDAAANSWNQWVLGYDPSRQLQVLSNIGLRGASWRTMAVVLIVVVSIIVLAMAAMLLRQHRAAPRDPVVSAYRTFCAKLAKGGFSRQPAEGPRDFAARVAEAKPEHAAAIAAISRLYIDLRYGVLAERAAAERLARLVKQLKI
ncbi:MAG: transglutaminase TgpA family protein [Burkholderiales bacterium]|nr:DUF3488 domain-containing transglutaminase family protein [Burkholderiales bacterium]MDQ3197510.1 DUF3488 and transglutaminase-like domain-containing protein [Pseudomonadota bacterium]